MRMGTRTVAVCAVVCLHAAARGRARKGPDARRGVGASARTGTADRQRAVGIGGGARTAARGVRSVSGEPGDRRGARQSQRAGHAIHRLRAGHRPELRAAVPADPRGLPAPTLRSRKAPRTSTRSPGRCSAWRPRRTTARSTRMSGSGCSNATHELAAGVYAIADRRFKAGDIAVLDVNIARASLARVRAEREGRGSREGARAWGAAAASASRE